MPTKLVVNVSAGIEEYVEMTAEEITQREVDSVARQAEREVEEAAATAKATEKASANTKLKALGLTDAEIAALVS